MTRPSLIELGNNLDINDNFVIMTHDFATHVFRNLYGDYVNSSGKVVIGNNIYFGRNVTILKGVTIGDNCIIGLGSVVTKNIPSNSVVVGNPARVICYVEEYHKRRKSKQIQEALEYGRSIKNRFHREPQITDFTEEWVLFLSEEDYNNFPKMKTIVDWRINKCTSLEKFFQSPRPFNCWEEFKKEVLKSIF
ncbi:MAG: acyltransferase [Bacteroidota bacterium]|nr:acyltransferase [Bacteroidota bacterium]